MNLKYGYARVSTKEQKLNLQMDALEKENCDKIFVDVASGAKKERPELEKMLEQAREGDIIVIWKLDRLGRSLKHLVEIIEHLNSRSIAIKSLNDPIDTTSAQGKLVYNIFASLAEFEREIIRERTKAGLSAARARGRMGGRPKGLSKEAQSKACAAETLYKERKLTVKQICEQLGISKATLYSYLRFRGVQIGPGKSNTKQAIETSEQEIRTKRVRLTLDIENNTKWVRGKSRSRADIERFVLSQYQMNKLEKNGIEYDLVIPYKDDSDLDETIQNIFYEMYDIVDGRNGFMETYVKSLDDEDKFWD